MKIDTLDSLVATADLYRALAEIRLNITPLETRQFLIYKIRKTCKEMRDTANYVEKRLPPKPKKGRGAR